MFLPFFFYVPFFCTNIAFFILSIHSFDLMCDIDGRSLGLNCRMDIIKLLSSVEMLTLISYDPDEIFVLISSKVSAGNGAVA